MLSMARRIFSSAALSSCLVAMSRRMLSNSCWATTASSSNVMASWTCIWYIPWIYFVGLNLFNFFLFVFISVNDVIHKYTHTTLAETPALITFLQKNFIIQSYGEHHIHHTEPFEKNYCTITPYINFPLEKINFWRKLEFLIEKVTGIKPRSHIDSYIENSAYPAAIKFV